MTFTVIFIGLLIERFFDWSHLRHWQWYTRYQEAVLKRFSTHSPYIVLAAMILPIVIVIALLSLILQGWLYGLIKLIFSIIIFIYCLGPKDLWAEAFANANVLKNSEADSKHPSLNQAFLSHIFVEANRRVFSVVFWFALLGPVGAVLYRCATLSTVFLAKQDSALLHLSRQLEALLSWLPARLLTVLFALGGHFVQVLTAWRKHALEGLDSNETLLMECGTAALGLEETQAISNGAARGAINLLDRSFIIMLVIIGLLVSIF